MLTISQYGVTLRRLQHSDIEQVRLWRNSATVRSNMQFREHISPEQQEAWFKSVNNCYNYYFLIFYDDKPQGVINAKNYDPEKGFGEGGIFMSPDCDNILVPVLATLCFLNFIFRHLSLEISRARILRSNLRAISYNRELGYRLIPGQDNEDPQLYELRKSEYLKRSERLNHAACLLAPDQTTLRIAGSPDKLNITEINRLLADRQSLC